MSDLTEEVARAIWRDTYRHNTLLEWSEVEPGTLYHKRTVAAAQAAIAIALKRAAAVASSLDYIRPGGYDSIGHAVQDTGYRIAQAILSLSPNRSREG